MAKHWTLILLATYGLALVACAEVQTSDSTIDDGSQLTAHIPLEGYCTHEPVSIEKWEPYSSAIFIGVVKEIKLTIPEYSNGMLSNSCWARVKPNYKIKGIAENEIWVQALYSDYGKDVFDIKNCWLKNEKYFFMGSVGTLINSGSPYVVVAKSTSSYCAPVIKIENDEQEFKLISESSKKNG